MLEAVVKCIVHHVVALCSVNDADWRSTCSISTLLQNSKHTLKHAGRDFPDPNLLQSMDIMVRSRTRLKVSYLILTHSRRGHCLAARALRADGRSQPRP